MRTAGNAKKSAAKKQAVIPETATAMGTVRIHDNVIASLVRRAALSVDGVSRLAGNTLMDNLAEIVGSRRMQERSISVDSSAEGKVGIDVKLNLKFGFKAQQVAQAVQQAVIEAVGGTTGMEVTGVNVLIQEIDDDEPENEDEDEDVRDSVPQA